jgi:hypothetical protein
MLGIALVIWQNEWLALPVLLALVPWDWVYRWTMEGLQQVFDARREQKLVQKEELVYTGRMR